mmetsp:Transcript_45870/g.132848  ORF Transcript_45870/g.132848 Transcript_45870/m.132848 type:complete len:242 (-) Transcript_45870:473-1198(-)
MAVSKSVILFQLVTPGSFAQALSLQASKQSFTKSRSKSGPEWKGPPSFSRPLHSGHSAPGATTLAVLKRWLSFASSPGAATSPRGWRKKLSHCTHWWTSAVLEAWCLALAAESVTWTKSRIHKSIEHANSGFASRPHFAAAAATACSTSRRASSWAYAHFRAVPPYLAKQVSGLLPLRMGRSVDVMHNNPPSATACTAASRKGAAVPDASKSMTSYASSPSPPAPRARRAYMWPLASSLAA